jgi:hypothetical protein
MSLAPLLGLDLGQLALSRMTYDLGRLHLRSLIGRTRKTHRYRVTIFALRLALFVIQIHVQVLRPRMAIVIPEIVSGDSALHAPSIDLSAR